MRESSPAECSLPFLSRCSLLELQLRPQRCDLRAARDGPRPAAGPCQLIGCATLKASVSSPRDHVELVKPQMRLERRVELQHCGTASAAAQIAAKSDRQPFVVTSRAL